LSKLATPYCFKILLYHAYIILDKVVLNQEKVIDAVNSFIWCSGVSMFAIILNKTENNEKGYQLVSQSPCNRSINDSVDSVDGRDCIFLGRYFKICVRKPGRGQVYQTGFCIS
jgi:hypothetical protein